MNATIRHALPGRIRFELTVALAAGEVARLARILGAVPGVKSVQVNPRTRSVLVQHAEAGEARADVVRALERVRPEELQGGEPDAPDELAGEKRALLAAAVRSLLGLALGGLPKVALALWGAVPFLRSGAVALRQRRLGADVLDAVAIATALRIRDDATASSVTFLLRLGEYLRHRTEHRARQDMERMLARDEQEAWVIRDGREVRVQGDELAAGDRVVVRAGHAIPVDGRVVAGEALVNQASLTGEPLPVRRRTGASVYEGSTVVEGRLEVEAVRVGADTRMARIGRMIADAERHKATAQARADRLADGLVPYVFGAAGLVHAWRGDPATTASVLLVDYSCALKLSVPIAIRTCLAQALQDGVLIRGGRFVEALARADTVVFDKTGTLTEARPRVVEFVTFGAFRRSELLRDAACVEEHFPHPFASAIVREAERRGVVHRDEEHEDVHNVVAQGVVSTVRGRHFVVGSRRFLLREGVRFPHEAACLERQAGSRVYVGVDGALAGVFLLEDAIRPEAAQVIARLRALGLGHAVLLTGDNEENARRLAALGFDRFASEVSPEEKAELVSELRGQGRRVLVLGDGLNDAPALASADVGVSFQLAADVAKEAADVLLLRQDLRTLPAAIELCRSAMDRVDRTVRTVVGVNSTLIAAALVGRMTPAASALAHNLTTIGTSVSALRPYRQRRAARREPAGGA